jgi:hypothetical protein
LYFYLLFLPLFRKLSKKLPVALQEKIDETVSDSDMKRGGIIPSSEALSNQKLFGESCLRLDDTTDVIATVTSVFDNIFADQD